MAMKAPAERLAYVAAFDPERKVPDGIAVVDVDPASKSYSKIVNTVAMPNAGDEVASFRLERLLVVPLPNAPHPHSERRYLVVPGLRSSRIHILDTKPDPRSQDGQGDRAGGSGQSAPDIRAPIPCTAAPKAFTWRRSATARAGPRRRIPDGPRDLRDPRPMEIDRGPQHFAYDAWWHLGHDTMVTSE
jgi:selenium-binding protein 1